MKNFRSKFANIKVFSSQQSKSSIFCKALGLTVNVVAHKGPVVAEIYHSSPTALCGLVAIGDIIKSVDAVPVDEATDVAAMGKMLDGELGTPVWLELCHAVGTEPFAVTLLRQAPLEDERDEAVGELGLKLEMCERGCIVRGINDGGAAWLVTRHWTASPEAGQEDEKREGKGVEGEGEGEKGGAREREVAGSEGASSKTSEQEVECAVIGVGDTITRINGKSLSGMSRKDVRDMLIGKSFVRLALECTDGKGRTRRIDMIRCTRISNGCLAAAKAYFSSVAGLPDLPPMARTDRRRVDVQGQLPCIAELAPTEAVNLVLENSAEADGRPWWAGRIPDRLLTSELRWSISALCAGFLAKMLKRQTRVLAELSSKEAETVLREEEVAVEGGDGIQSESDSFTLVDSLAMSGAIVGWYRRYLSIICRDLAVDSRSLEALQQMMEDDHVDMPTISSFIIKSQEKIAGDARKQQEVKEGTSPREPKRAEETQGEGKEKRSHLMNVLLDGQEHAEEEEEPSSASAVPAAVAEVESAAKEEEETAREDRSLQWIICWMILSSSLSTKKYDARARSLVRRLSDHLRIPWKWISCAEIAFSEAIIRASILEQSPQDSSSSAKPKSKYLRAAKIGGAAVVGGALIGLTGGLAAPAVIAGLGLVGSAVGIGGTLAAGAAAFGGLSAVLGVSFGAAGAGLCGYKMMRRTAELDEFAFDLIDTSPGLPVTIGVTGWLLDEDDSAWKVWDRALCSVASDGGETLALRWESKQLREMGRVVSSYLKSQAGYYTTSVVGSVVLGAAFFSLTWPRTLISAASWIDSTWSVTELRADKAGKELARTLASRVQGYRPVTLVGFGVGARMIFKCLLELSKLGAEGAGIVETAICMGTPCPANPKDWRRASSVCGHRLVNAYCQTDWVLSFLYRSSSFSRSVAGLQAIQLEGEENSNLENVDVTGIVKGHWDYRDKIHTLMQVFGLSSGFSVSVPASQEEEKVPETEPITVETSKEET